MDVKLMMMMMMEVHCHKIDRSVKPGREVSVNMSVIGSSIHPSD